MNIGSIVIATAGKEKGQLYVVVKTEDKFVYLSDGKRLKTSKPKKKSRKHVKPFGLESLHENEVIDKNERANALIRKFLSNKRGEECQKTT